MFLAVRTGLLVACANVANMLLARGLSEGERSPLSSLSVPAAAASFSSYLPRAFFSAVIGGCVGLLMAEYGARAVLAMIPSDMMGRHQTRP